ncbi:MAG: CDP-glycerol glycerophosphotransferase family protein [Candidatus Cloacimonetes bacterium]|nr:CDP-glycerol glycerophosphotransferase family protein [Candidatus Cloacimonadota bacterium]MDD2211327.1 CDP-glycerol glycerophosphotransferase family protein [Candidatus Cloacimonadota bacterium]MDD3282842.1 CDP-glycerol glycerophosphotransferase family protein [Candidatus Cloacimonadota bacterium]MDD4232650.1 CDP-glycerol glycerophosphotransferase family protein [Candidatus Cloacimonadota bacterium]
MKKIKLLFRIGYAYHKAAFDPIIDLLIDNPRYDVWFSLDMEKIKYFFIEIPYRNKLIKQWEQLGYRFTTKTKGFDIVISGDTLRNAKDYGKTLLIFLNHGTGIKNILYRNLERAKGHKYQIFVEGQHRVDSLLACPHLGSSEVHLIGLPKLDYYFKAKYKREDVLQSLGLDLQKKTLLFAPTYKPTCMYQIKDDIFEQTKDYNLIIKLHPYSWMGKYAPHKQHRIFQRRVGRYPHARLLPFNELSILPYYVAADTILSEASSTVFDFIAFQKYGIVYDLPCDKLIHSDGQALLEIDNRLFLEGAFPHIQSGKELPQAIWQALHPSSEMKARANDYRDRYFYKLDGKASERFIQKMEVLYAESGHENEV